jgi:hypothetical protein
MQEIEPRSLGRPPLSLANISTAPIRLLLKNECEVTVKLKKNSKKIS